MAALPALARPPRIAGIDVARGLAAVLMVQGHAFDAWASDEAKASWAYAIERALLQSLALPAFLVLAGASLALRVEAGIARGEAASAVRGVIVRRALSIVAVGYGLNAVSALIDGWDGPETWLRADVLHVIGLSLCALALGIRGRTGDGTIAPRALGTAAAVLAIVPVVICPWLSRLSAGAPGPIGWALALFVDVPGITRMPLVPLVSWAAVGALVARAMIARNREARSIAGAPDRVLVAMMAIAGVVAVVGTLAQDAIVAAVGGPLARTHVAVIPNAVQLAARGIGVLAVGAWLAPRLPERARRAMVVVGQGSLWAYAFHVPLCYGRFADWAGLRGALSLAECALAAFVLVVLSAGAAAAKWVWTDARARRAPGAR